MDTIKKIFDKNLIFQAFKIAIGCVLAILICSIFKVNFSATAGLITVLSIQATKKETVFTALKRLISFFIAILISGILFTLIGYTTISFGIYLLLFVIFCNLFQFQAAIVPISVLITHILTLEDISFSIILNEFILLIVGAGIGVILNLYLRKDNSAMNDRRIKLDDEIKAILNRMSIRILEDDKSDYNGDCFKRIHTYISDAQSLAEKNYNNTLLSSQTYDITYVKMRSEQCRILYDMYICVKQLDTTPNQAIEISNFLKKISEEYDEKNTVETLIQDIDQIFENMKQEQMPITRQEFENRALLYALLLKTKEFLRIKNIFMINQTKEH